ncbi:hypothetical protein G6F22_020772 [Rhizopus arrhizus]|nr:hypothetical protein G6F22_020772 [Rhizopus arrhizus]KAG1192787.1 hypothetical protein G6F35_013585 [Rhizopus arrhizus]
MMRAIVPQSVQLDLVQPVFGLRVALVRAAARLLLRHVQVVQQAELAEDARHLEGAAHAQPGHFMDLPPADLAAVQFDAAFVRRVDAVDAVEHRGLT